MPDAIAEATPPGQQSFASVVKLALCNGLGISAAVISVTASALVAGHVGWTGAMATVPYGLQFLSLLLATYPSARLMSRHGRKPVFLAAAGFGMLGGMLGYLAVLRSDPVQLCLAHLALGVMLANANFYRFAALEVARPERSASAMSLVVFGGTFAAIIGPVLSRQAIFSADLFASAYLSIVALGAVTFCLLVSTRLPSFAKAPAGFGRRELVELARQPRILIGAGFAAIGYGAMNLLMIASSLTMEQLGCVYEDISVAIQWHVLAMFLPSLVMGRIIAQVGAFSVALAGGVILMATSAIAFLNPMSIPVLQACLISLGLGWNMTYVGGSYLVAKSVAPRHALSAQAVNDLAIGVFAMIGAFLPGVIVTSYGWAGANLLVIAALLPVVLMAALQKLRAPQPQPQGVEDQA